MPRFKLVLCCLICATAWSQEFRATITGRIVDSQNAVVVGARITATRIATGAKSETTSGADGGYTIPFLTPGTYRVEAQVSGFKRYVRDGLEVSTGERMGLDIRLELGQILEMPRFDHVLPQGSLEAHAGLLHDAARGRVTAQVRGVDPVEAQRVEAESEDGPHRLGRVAAIPEGLANPIAQLGPAVLQGEMQTDRAHDPVRLARDG